MAQGCLVLCAIRFLGAQVEYGGRLVREEPGRGGRGWGAARGVKGVTGAWWGCGGRGQGRARDIEDLAPAGRAAV